MIRLILTLLAVIITLSAQITQVPSSSSGGGGTWGTIIGTLSDQTDLNTALGLKAVASRAINTTAPIAGGGNLSADRTITCNVASSSQPGCLSAADWTTFNAKAPTASPTLTGTVTIGNSFSLNGTTGVGTYTGSQIWQAHNAMGNLGSVDYFDSSVLSVVESFVPDVEVDMVYLEANFNQAVNRGNHDSVTLTAHTILNGTHDFNNIYNMGGQLLIDSNTSGIVGTITGGSLKASVGAGTVDSILGAQESAQISGGSVATMAGSSSWLWLYSGATAGTVYNYWAKAPQDFSGTLTGSLNQFYGEDLGGFGSVAYYSWFDSRGVGRCKEDSAFNGTGQVICAVYNNAFVKYTPGAVNYERGVYGEWDASNVYHIGTEAGGTGTLRGVKMIGASLAVPVTTGAASGKHVLCVDNATKVIYESSTGTDCSN